MKKYHEVLHEVADRSGMPLSLPRASLTHLPDAPLQVALAQVRFAPVHAIEKPERVADFQDHLADSYVAREPQVPQTFTIQFGPVSAGPPLAPERVWPFEDQDRGWSVTLSSSSLALQASSYADFEHFAAEFRSALSALSETFKPKLRSRIGLRYINEISDPRLEAGAQIFEVIRPELLSPIGGDLGFDLAGSLCELRFHEPQGILGLRHGLIRPGTYLLDFDYFIENEVEFSSAEIGETVGVFHETIERLFVWCLADGYLNELREGEHAG